MRTVPLGEVIKLSYGKALKQAERGGGPVPVVGSGGVVGHHTTGLTAGPTVVVGRKGSIGSITWIDGPAWPIDTAYFVEHHASDIDSRWCFWLLQSLGLERMNKAAAIPGLNREDVYRLTIRLPAVAEQRRVAAILDHADALRAKRRQVLAHLDDLTQSIFHDMVDLSEGELVRFGDVVTAIGNGVSPKCESRPASPHEWGVLKLGAVTYGVFDQEENKAFLGDVGAMSKNEVRPGDVLMTRKNTRDLVGAVAVVGENVRSQLLLPDLIFRLSLDGERLRATYFHALMSTVVMRNAVRNLSSGSAASMPNISKARLRELSLRIPDLSLQSQFEERAESIEKVRARVFRAMDADDELFASLQSRAFRGEL